MGLIDAGYFELSEDILTNFAKKGDIPGKVNLEGKDRTKYSGESDTSPLYLIAADKLRRHFRINDQIQDGIRKAKHNLTINQEGVAIHSPEGTWMDTLNREKAIEIQSLWLEAAKHHNMDEKEELRKGLSLFKQEEYMKDSLKENDMATINPAVPLMYGQIQRQDATKYLEKINAEFSSRYGARTVSMLEPDYNSSGYHTGSSWGLTTAWAAAANLKYGKYKQGLNMLGKLRQFLDRGQLGALPEVVNSENGESLGCSEQAWSSGLIPHVIDSYILGIKARNPNEVVIDPIEGLDCLRAGKKIGDSEIDIKVSEGEPEVLNNPELKVITEG
ncbi:MAG: glycogen debranching enzyme [Candidatus Nanosalina sp. J07AB43]|nr:MAG: glycogen debranching enzyme [Candidatus Nanosalina sp. J07AB43]